MSTIQQYAKFIAALIGAAATAFAGLLPEDIAPWVQATVAFLTAFSVLVIPNALTETQKQELNGKHEAGA